MRVATLLLCTTLVGSALHAQDVSAPVPASVALQLRSELDLDEAQAGKLRELARTQGAAYLRTVSVYLRAEADVIDAARGDDLALRRTSLEKRAKLAIDAEIARVRWEKEVRAILNPKQNAAYSSGQSRSGSRPMWHTLVGPTVLAVAAAQPSDSGEVRIAVTPVYADIYMDAVKVGTGRKFLVLPVGKYEIKLHALGCAEVVLPIEITRGPPVVINQTLSCGK